MEIVFNSGREVYWKRINHYDVTIDGKNYRLEEEEDSNSGDFNLFDEENNLVDMPDEWVDVIAEEMQEQGAEFLQRIIYVGWENPHYVFHTQWGFFYLW